MITIEKQNRILEIHKTVTSKTEYLDARERAENNARNMLKENPGVFDEKDLNTFLTYCNTERVPKDHFSDKINEDNTCTRFELSFKGMNRNLMISTIDECNKWIKLFWDADEEWFVTLHKFWKINEVAGAGTGFPTMLLYLKDPEKFNVWLPYLNDSLSLLIDYKIPGKKSIENYILYNHFINSEFKQGLGLKPQEVDYILYRIKAELN